MKIHYLKHVPFEGLGSMQSFFADRDYELDFTNLYEEQPLPDMDAFHGLVVMGGPMGVYDDLQYPWLEKEKLFIKNAIQAGKKVLGICLGAQLIAQVLGAEVYKNKHKEIGWFPIEISREIETTIFKDIFTGPVNVFHWHGDTFDIPEKAVPLASSRACANQGFLFDERVAGFQFHLETTAESARSLVEHCGDELDGSEFVQSEQIILGSEEKFIEINSIMAQVLDRLF